MSQQRSHKSPHEYSDSPKAKYLREYRNRPELKERRERELARHYERRRERLANDPEYRAKHCAKNNARLKVRRGSLDTWVRVALNQCRNRALANGYPFDILPDDIIATTHCPVFGGELHYGAKVGDPWCPSFDKLRPELGYVKGNVRIISRRANSIKNDATVADIKAVLAYMEREGL